MGSFVGASNAGGNVAALTAANGAPLAYPAGIAANDLAILPWTFGPSTTVVTSGPTGYTLKASATDGNDQSRVYFRVLTGSESGNISGWLLDTINRQSADLFVVRGFSSIAAAVSFLETVTGTSHDCPQVTTGDGAANGDSIVIIGTDRAGSTGPTTAPAGFSKQTNSEAVASGTGGTLTVVADDGLVTAQTMPFDPGAFTGFTSGGTAVTWTLALRPSSTDATPAPAAVASVVAVPQATPSGNAVATPAVISAVTSLPTAAAITGGSATVTPAAVVSTAALPAAAPSGAATVTPAQVVTTVALPQAAHLAGATVVPAAVVSVVAIPRPAVGVAVGPAAVTAIAALPTATPVAVGNATATPGVVVTVVTVPTPTPIGASAGNGAITNPAFLPGDIAQRTFELRGTIR